MRLKLSLKIVAATMLMLLATVTSASSAELMPKALIVIIDVNYVLGNSVALKNAEQTLRNEARIVTDSLKVEGDALLEDKKQLDLQRAILASDVYNQKLADLNRRRQQLQRQAQQSSAQLNKALNSIRLKLRERVIQVAAGVGAEKGANIGMDRASTVFFDNTMDITAEVLAAFDKLNPKINITVEKKQ